MLQDIPQAQCVNMPACHHDTIVFRDSEVCDQVLRDSLYCKVFVLWGVFAIDGGHVSACI